MFTIIENQNVGREPLQMQDLKGGELAQVVEEGYQEDIVVCVKHLEKKLFLILNQGAHDSYDSNCPLMVRLLDKPITVEFTNDWPLNLARHSGGNLKG